MSAKRKKKDQVFTESTMTDILQDEERQNFNEMNAENKDHFAEKVYQQNNKREDK